ncbi:hypothetical protein P8452_47983 [Trifolium repens]|nr:hypothetical protein P8452_47983 [Trifolium repens]
MVCWLWFASIPVADWVGVGPVRTDGWLGGGAAVVLVWVAGGVYNRVLFTASEKAFSVKIKNTTQEDFLNHSGKKERFLIWISV